MNSQLLIFGAIALIWVFLLILPQRKETKRREKMQAGIKKGDRVILQCGIIGKVHGTKDEAVVLEFDGTKIPFLKNTVIKVVDDKEPATSEKKA